eukprot:6525379-Prymnesium_polylepis.1
MASSRALQSRPRRRHTRAHSHADAAAITHAGAAARTHAAGASLPSALPPSCCATLLRWHPTGS